VRTDLASQLKSLRTVFEIHGEHHSKLGSPTDWVSGSMIFETATRQDVTVVLYKVVTAIIAVCVVALVALLSLSLSELSDQAS
jgi:hypothetical protein